MNTKKSFSPSVVSRELACDGNREQAMALEPGVDLDLALELTRLAEQVMKRRIQLTDSYQRLACARTKVIDGEESAWKRWRFCYQRARDCVAKLTEAVANYNQTAVAEGHAPIEDRAGPRAGPGRPRKWVSLPQAYLARQALQKDRDRFYYEWQGFESYPFIYTLQNKVDEENEIRRISFDYRLKEYAEEFLKPRGDYHAWPAADFERSRAAGYAIMGYLKAKDGLRAVNRAIIKLKAEQKAAIQADYQRERQRNLAYIANKQKTNRPGPLERGCAAPGKV